MRSLTSMAAALVACVLVSGCNMLSTSHRPVRPVETPAPPAPAAPAEQAEAPAMTEYPLGAGDIVKITVYNSPDLTTEAEISQKDITHAPL